MWRLIAMRQMRNSLTDLTEVSRENRKGSTGQETELSKNTLRFTAPSAVIYLEEFRTCPFYLLSYCVKTSEDKAIQKGDFL